MGLILNKIGLSINLEFIMLDLLFETSWEVCNKVGGIYAVLSTKAKTLQKLFKDKVIFIGPDIWSESNPSPFFKEMKTPLDAWKNSNRVPADVQVRTGRWDVPGRPLVVLVNFNKLYATKNDLYATMWQHFGVDSLHAYGDYDESCVFSHAAALVIESIVQWKGVEPKNVVTHFDEWTTGMGLLHVKLNLPEASTVFTTHATTTGRSISGNGKQLYAYLPGYFGDQMASELNVQAKHSLEKAAAQQATSFTTVSEVTARECEQLLERRPLVTPNGFEQNFVPKAADFDARRNEARAKLLKVAKMLTGKRYNKNTLIVGTSGRQEFRNKGLDMFLDTMNELRSDSSTQVLAFVLVPGWTKTVRTDLAESLTKGKYIPLQEPCITHELHNPNEDPILGTMRRMGFNNDVADNVHVIYVPCYLNGDDGIFNMTYYQLLIGLDLTVFASYYEPWGYTPLESIAFGVPTVTTNLSGFGQWVLSNVSTEFEHCGVKVIDRTDHNYHHCVVEIQDFISNFASLDSKTVAKITQQAKRTSRMASWSNFIKYYLDAYGIDFNE